jgi:phosphoenolpyruvate phosphomutase
MIIARVESLILGVGMEDAVERAAAYIEAGADGILMHSCAPDPGEILEFADRYAAFAKRVPLVVVPSTYSQVRESELEAAGVNVVIYANHLMRSAYPAMQSTARSILEHTRSLETDESLMPISEVLRLIPGAA